MSLFLYMSSDMNICYLIIEYAIKDKTYNEHIRLHFSYIEDVFYKEGTYAYLNCYYNTSPNMKSCYMHLNKESNKIIIKFILSIDRIKYHIQLFLKKKSKYNNKDIYCDKDIATNEFGIYYVIAPKNVGVCNANFIVI